MGSYAPVLTSPTHVVHDAHGYGVASTTKDGRVDVTFYQNHSWEEIRDIAEGRPHEHLKISVDEESLLRNPSWHLGLDESAVRNILDDIRFSSGMYFHHSDPLSLDWNSSHPMYLSRASRVSSFVTKSIDSALMLSLSTVKAIPDPKTRTATFQKYLDVLDNKSFFSTVLYPLMQEKAREDLDEVLAQLTLRISVACNVSVQDAEIEMFSAINERVNNVHTRQIKGQMHQYRNNQSNHRRGRNNYGIHPVQQRRRAPVG